MEGFSSDSLGQPQSDYRTKGSVVLCDNIKW
jgi:hypothetical protein